MGFRIALALCLGLNADGDGAIAGRRVEDVIEIAAMHGRLAVKTIEGGLQRRTRLKEYYEINDLALQRQHARCALWYVFGIDFGGGDVGRANSFGPRKEPLSEDQRRTMNMRVPCSFALSTVATALRLELKSR